jgi:hypothetical protein
MAETDEPRLQLHLEPRALMEVTELTAALGSLARQYQVFAIRNSLARKPSDARLLVSSVSPGSIDISLLPDLAPYLATAGMLAPLIDKADLVLKFGKSIKALLELFQKKKEASATEAITIRDCDDAINITKPIAKNGGSQTFNTIHGGVSVTILTMNASEASAILETALFSKTLLQNPNGEVRQRVPMIWKRLDRDETKPAAKSSPDRGLIEEIDAKSHAVMFTDETAYLKKQMIDDEENPYHNVYFVDVAVSRVADKVISYRILGYHGKEELDASMLAPPDEAPSES